MFTGVAPGNEFCNPAADSTAPCWQRGNFPQSQVVRRYSVDCNPPSMAAAGSMSSTTPSFGPRQQHGNLPGVSPASQQNNVCMSPPPYVGPPQTMRLLPSASAPELLPATRWSPEARFSLVPPIHLKTDGGNDAVENEASCEASGASMIGGTLAALNSVHPMSNLVNQIADELWQNPPPSIAGSKWTPVALKRQLSALITEATTAQSGRPLSPAMGGGVLAEAFDSEAAWAAFEKAVRRTCRDCGVNEDLTTQLLAAVRVTVALRRKPAASIAEDSSSLGTDDFTGRSSCTPDGSVSAEAVLRKSVHVMSAPTLPSQPMEESCTLDILARPSENGKLLLAGKASSFVAVSAPKASEPEAEALAPSQETPPAPLPGSNATLATASPQGTPPTASPPPPPTGPPPQVSRGHGSTASRTGKQAGALPLRQVRLSLPADDPNTDEAASHEEPEGEQDGQNESEAASLVQPPATGQPFQSRIPSANLTNTRTASRQRGRLSTGSVTAPSRRSESTPAATRRSSVRRRPPPPKK